MSKIAPELSAIAIERLKHPGGDRSMMVAGKRSISTSPPSSRGFRNEEHRCRWRTTLKTCAGPTMAFGVACEGSSQTN